MKIHLPGKKESSNKTLGIPTHPPIYIYEVSNFNDMVNSISNIINKNEFICKAIKNSNIKINVSTIEAYRKLSKFLKERNIIHHTYQLK